MTDARGRYEAARRLIDQGKSYAEAAEILGWTRSMVAGIIARHRQDDPNPKMVCHVHPVGSFPTILAAARYHGLSESGYRYQRSTGKIK